MRHERRRYVVPFGVCLAALLAASGCASLADDAPPSVELITPDRLARWEQTPRPPWTLNHGVFQGHGSWVGYDELFGDFVLECEFLFEGEQGGIAIRGDRSSHEPWASGYELDIDWAPDDEHGHIHFPVWPKSPVGEALFEVGEWHTVRIEARGPEVRVWLDGEEALGFCDDRFLRGHLILEGEHGGVKYRDLRVSRIGP